MPFVVVSPTWQLAGVSVVLAFAVLFGLLAIWTFIIYVRSPVPTARRRRRRRPLRSTKRDAKRRAWEYAREVTGKPRLGWKAAKKLLDKWDREGKAIAAMAGSDAR